MVNRGLTAEGSIGEPVGPIVALQASRDESGREEGFADWAIIKPLFDRFINSPFHYCEGNGILHDSIPLMPGYRPGSGAYQSDQRFRGGFTLSSTEIQQGISDGVLLKTIPIYYERTETHYAGIYSLIYQLEGNLSLRIVFASDQKLVALNVISGATQRNVIGDNNWASIRNDTGDVIVEAITEPNTMEAWERINWSGDVGTAVPGKPNQRRLSRSTSQLYRVQAALGGVSDEVNLWIIGANITIMTNGQVPENAPRFGNLFDSTENLGAVTYDNGNKAAGKIVAIAKITPEGIHNVIRNGWSFKREKMGVRFENSTPNPRWQTWVDDTSQPNFLNLLPDSSDQIYDIDAPTIGGADWFNTNEVYINFRQSVEWNGEKCSDYAYWYWTARWMFSAQPQVTLMEVGRGTQAIPEHSLFQP